MRSTLIHSIWKEEIAVLMKTNNVGYPMNHFNKRTLILMHFHTDTATKYKLRFDQTKIRRYKLKKIKILFVCLFVLKIFWKFCRRGAEVQTFTLSELSNDVRVNMRS